MDTFGERLRSEREDRGLTIQAVAEILGVDHDRLLALERNDFVALPDEAAMADFLRAYADCLQVDAELMIEDYTQEREKCLTQLADALTEPAVEVAPASIPSALEDPPRYPRLLAASVVLGTIAMLAAWWMLAGDAPAPSEMAAVPPTATDSAAAAHAETPPLAQAPPAAQQSATKAARSPEQRPVQRSAPTGSTPPIMSIPDFGVGTGIKNRQLVGRGERFAEGTQVWFWTRVQGGDASNRVEHVWLRDDVEMTSISLPIGGSSWRTYSAKTLRPGSAGDWTVEARDEAGRVLARRAFACTP